MDLVLGGHCPGNQGTTREFEREKRGKSGKDQGIII